MINDSYCEEIAEGVLDLLMTNGIFSVYRTDSPDDCIIVWSSSANELIAARIQEVMDR